jgi:hypothetical protein
MTNGNQNSASDSFSSGLLNKLVMKEIKLTRGLFAQVNDEDFDYLNQWKWMAHKDRKNYYAVRVEYKPRKKTIFMHRLILNTPDKMLTDHIDHNGLNNRRLNLRNCTQSQNSMNQKPHSITKYLGVYYNKKRNNYQASIRVNRKNISLGFYKTAKEAAMIRDIASLKYFGEFAYLNFKTQ